MNPLQILFEDEDLIAVNKPAGLPSQGTVDPRRPHVISVLKQQMPTGREFFLHHRLDKDTSGVLLLGKSKRANAPLTEIFREHQIEKIYWAVSLRKNATSEKGPQAVQFEVQDHLAPVRGAGKQLMRMVQVKKGGWAAETYFRTLQESKDFFLFEARPITGRTHQIRVHLAGLKLPIAGDFLYGGKSSEVPRLMLHAKTLSLKHPISQEPLTIEAPLPKDFQSLIDKFFKKEIL
jgi:RluA family pseudouridine synthase